MKRTINKIWASKFWWLLLLLIIFGINFLGSVFHSRFDLTKEKRYTLSRATKELLRNIDEPVTINVFLKGNFPAGFKKLAIGVDEFLQECKEASKGKMKVNFTEPFAALNDSIAQRFRDSIQYFYDIPAYTLQAPGKVGDDISFKQVLPGAIIHYKDTSVGVNLLSGVRSYGTEPEQLAALYNQVEATLEYKFVSAIQKVTSDKKPLVGYLLGNGETWGPNVDDAVRTLATNYRFDTINLKSDRFIPSIFDAVVMIKPIIKFNDDEKLKIDQYLMRGGKLFCFIDNLYDGFDSLYNKDGFIAYDRDLNMEDMLFRYGIRLNQALLEDMQCDKLPMVSGQQGQTQQQRLVDWPIFPILNGTNHPISKNLDGIRAMFPSTIDTVTANGITKIILLQSSGNARVIPTPEKVVFDFFQVAPDIREFNKKNVPVAVLLEGEFRSLYDNRISKAKTDTLANLFKTPFVKTSQQGAKLIVVSDGDIPVNQVSQTKGALAMGQNMFTGITFANKDFFTNSMEYLVNPSGILETRTKEFTLRLLDPKKVKSDKGLWQFVNIALPVLLIILAGFVYQQVRKKKYAS